MFQFMGLTPEAEKYLDDNCVKTVDKCCPHCGKAITEKLLVWKVEHHNSFYGDGPDLHTYHLKDGGKVKEIIQAEPWSSGPVCFLCLELCDGAKIGKWTNEEIDNYSR